MQHKFYNFPRFVKYSFLLLITISLNQLFAKTLNSVKPDNYNHYTINYSYQSYFCIATIKNDYKNSVIFSDMDTSSLKICKLYSKDSVYVLEIKNNWLHILTKKGQLGWSPLDYYYIYEISFSTTQEKEDFVQKRYETSKIAADNGDKYAEFLLGYFYEYGEGVEQNDSLAFKWYQKSAVQGNSDAQYKLGYMFYEKGDEKEALKWYQKSAEQGNSDAQYKLGLKYREGKGVQKDLIESFKWFQKSSEQGNADAQILLAQYYLYGIGVNENKAEGIKWYRRAAYNGDSWAIRELRSIYLKGDSSGLNSEELLKLFDRIDTNTIWRNGKEFLNGSKYIIKNVDEGIFWLSYVAQKDPSYALELGKMYKGTDISVDYEKVKYWYEKAAAIAMSRYCRSPDDPTCTGILFELGAIYYKGEGVIQDKTKAVTFYRTAAEKGCAASQFNLACMYSNGEGGLLRSGSAAADWYYKAGLSYLKDKRREDALLCVERIQDLTVKQNLTIPNANLAKELYEKISINDGSHEVESSENEKQTTYGSGWIVKGGYVVTCYHVVEGKSKIKLLTFKGDTLNTSIQTSDPANDIALLKIEKDNIPGLAIPVSSGIIKKGESVFTIGYPHPDILGHECKISNGIVSSTTGIGGDVRMMQITVPVQAGNSGGPLLNNKGEVIGIIVAKLNAVQTFNLTGDLPENTNFAIKSAYLFPILASTETTQSIKEYPSAQLTLEKLSMMIAKSTLVVIAK